MNEEEEILLYCVPIIVDGRCYTTQSVHATDEDEACSLALLHWKNAKVDTKRPVTIVR